MQQANDPSTLPRPIGLSRSSSLAWCLVIINVVLCAVGLHGYVDAEDAAVQTLCEPALPFGVPWDRASAEEAMRWQMRFDAALVACVSSGIAILLSVHLAWRALGRRTKMNP